MAEYKRIRVMLSSRIRTQVDAGAATGGVEISVARQRLKEALETQTLFGLRLFEVWTSEAPDDQGLGLTEGAWKKSLAQVREADVVLVLYTGEAGWAPPNKNQGICHAEFLEAWNGERPKLKVVRVADPVLAPRDRAEAARDKRFRDDFERYVPVSPEAATVEDIVTLGSRQVWEAVAQLVGLGRREARRGEYSSGAPLDWNRMDFAKRKKEMEQALGRYFTDIRADARVAHKDNCFVLPLDGHPVLFVCHGIPAALTVPTAREMVGQPFLKDHAYVELSHRRSKQPAGPVHLIACQKSVTEAQAMRQLGFPDATIVKADFGVYVADEVQKIQMMFLANCRDEATTQDAAGKLFDWLASSGEAARLAARAEGRRKIVRAILDQLAD
jgi:hypothetical protein